MGGQGLNIPFFRLRAQCSDRLPGPEIRHGNGPSKAGRARRASSRHPFAMRRNLFSFDQLSPVFRWPRQASADPLAENARFGLSVGSCSVSCFLWRTRGRAVEGFAGAFPIVWMVPDVVEERLERHPQVLRRLPRIRIKLHLSGRSSVSKDMRRSRPAGLPRALGFGKPCRRRGRRRRPIPPRRSAPAVSRGADAPKGGRAAAKRDRRFLVSRAPAGRRKNASVEVDPGPSSVCGRATAQTAPACVPAYRATRMKRATWRLVHLSLGRPVEPT